jgi:Cytochrome c554 and c-prime
VRDPARDNPLVEVRMAASRRISIVVLAFILALPAGHAGATVEMQNQAKKLGFAVKNCLDCHASPHSIDVMKKKAKDTKMADGNCLACHGADIPAVLNHKGDWLVSEKGRRSADACDMAWLKDYKEPVAPKPPAGKPGTKPAPKP